MCALDTIYEAVLEGNAKAAQAGAQAALAAGVPAETILRKIGADGYSPDASSAVRLARSLATAA
jgi:methanogenic corrinoid protein MtbC1